MIRPLTLIGLFVFAGAAGYLFQIKHTASVLERDLRNTHRRTEAARERTQVLRAEWALLNEPERLRGVAQRHLALEPMTPQQFVRQAELARRLPPPAVFAGAPSLFAAPAGAAPPTAEPLMTERAVVPAAAPQADVAVAAQMAGASVRQPSAPAILASAQATPSAAPVARVAEPPRPAADGFRPYTEILRAAEPQAAPRPTQTVARRPALPMEPAVAAIAPRPALAATAPRAATDPSAARAVTISALGTQRGSLPPPVPFGR